MEKAKVRCLNETGQKWTGRGARRIAENWTRDAGDGGGRDRERACSLLVCVCVCVDEEGVGHRTCTAMPVSVAALPRS